jgi:tRNA-specific 2-thiouridylase
MADGIGADKIATGHYARLSYNEAARRFEMRKSLDASKDQTYFLWGLTQPQLARTLFPLGGMVKSDVRELARQLDLPVAQKNDSQEICFVPNGDYAAFIDAYFRENGVEPQQVEGDIVATDGRVLGRHRGTHHFTVGQRRGLRVAAADPLYVIQTDPKTQQVLVGANDDLLRGDLTARDVNWVSTAAPAEPRRAEVKIRNKHTAAAATLMCLGDATRVKVVFDSPQRAITPGQAAVFYDGDLVLGGGWIE